MNIEIRNSELQARIQRQKQATGSESLEEVLVHLLETQEEQDRWLSENRADIQAKIARGLEQVDRGKVVGENELKAHLTKEKAKRK